MLEDTQQTYERNWRKFLMSADARVQLEKELSTAKTIRHSTIINGKIVSDTYHKWHPDFPKGLGIAKMAVHVFFLKIFINRDRLKQSPEISNHFKNTYRGWKFTVNAEEYMEVDFV